MNSLFNYLQTVCDCVVGSSQIRFLDSLYILDICPLSDLHIVRNDFSNLLVVAMSY